MKFLLLLFRSGSNFNAEYTSTFDWVMASDRGKQQAYCKVCNNHISFSHSGIDDVRRHGQNGLKKNHGFSARCPAFFFFQKLNMSDFAPSQLGPCHHG